MRRLVWSLCVLVLVVAPAAAETDLVIVGPVASAKVTASQSAAVGKALAKTTVATRSDRAVDAACAADASCLATVGTELSARQVLAITVDKGRGGLAIGFVLADVTGKELVARRDVTIAERKLAKQLAVELQKFVDEAPIERAKVLFAQGNQHYNLGEFAQALEQYKRAYRAKPLPAFLFNIAQCHRKLGQHQEAVAMYQSYLAGVPNAQNKTMVESLIAESKTAVAEQQRLAEDAAKREADRIRAETEKQRAEEERRAKEAEARAAAERSKIEQARIAAEREREREKLYNKHPARKWAYVGGGIGAAALIAGGFFGVEARNAQSELDNAGCGVRDQLLTQDEVAACRDDRDRGQRAALFSNIFLFGGGAVLAASAIVFVIDPGNIERPTQSRAELHITPSSIQAVVRW